MWSRRCSRSALPGCCHSATTGGNPARSGRNTRPSAGAEELRYGLAQRPTDESAFVTPLHLPTQHLPNVAHTVGLTRSFCEHWVSTFQPKTCSFYAHASSDL